MTTHILKSWPLHFPDIDSGRKTFEIRMNDRNYRVGDTLILREWEPTTNVYTGRECSRLITYMTDFLQRTGYVILGIRPMRANEAPPEPEQVENQRAQEWPGGNP